jgi:hypothetical protein
MGKKVGAQILFILSKIKQNFIYRFFDNLVFFDSILKYKFVIHVTFYISIEGPDSPLHFAHKTLETFKKFDWQRLDQKKVICKKQESIKCMKSIKISSFLNKKLFSYSNLSIICVFFNNFFQLYKTQLIFVVKTEEINTKIFI